MKAIVIFILLLLCIVYTPAQTRYYTQTKTFTVGEEIYQCDVDQSRTATLYRKGDKWIYADQVYRDTGKHFTLDEETPDVAETVTDDFICMCKSIINSAFSKEQKERVKGHTIIISMYINSETGKINEVSFEFMSVGPYATIPISVYSKIEIGIKQKLSFKPTAEGKKLNYILYWIDVAPE